MVLLSSRDLTPGVEIGTSEGVPDHVSVIIDTRVTVVGVGVVVREVSPSSRYFADFWSGDPV